ncbi:lipopolysaccharide-induced factor LITAF-like [Acrasis kona]|uniref:Lipopolysaccharide-induced factor LITAF-like n=1 Tax=Acrasis kona TaxID=1008807 RepID=A0AAW2Z6H4_9EUKA
MQQYPTQVEPGPTQTTVTVVGGPQFGTLPVQFTCGGCGHQGQTYTSHKIGMASILCALLLLLTGFWCCFWIPLVIDGLKDVEHTCPQCKRVVGSKALLEV